MKRQPDVSHRLLVLGFLLLAACSTGLSEIPAPAEASAGEHASQPPDAPFPDTTAEFCDGTGDAGIEMAFAATIQLVVDGGPAPWVTFTVDRWFTDDLGTSISMWGPEFSGQEGERWLIAGSRYSIRNRAGGDVFWCASVPETAETLTVWNTAYGGSVLAGSGLPEGTADPAVLADIDEAEARWQAQGPDTYTATISYDSRSTRIPNCGSGPIRTVVVDGIVTEAWDIRYDCPFVGREPFTIENLFRLARNAAGAGVEHLVVNPELGYIEGFYAADRSVEISLGVTEFVPFAAPRSEGDRSIEVKAALARWEAADIDSYTATIEMRCFCPLGGRYEVTVKDHIITEWSTDSGIGPQPGDHEPPTIDTIFATLAQSLDADRLQMSFHPELGYPNDARIDPDINTIDDELDYFVLEFEPSN